MKTNTNKSLSAFFLSLVLICTLSLSSCRYYCQGFPDEYLIYIPYQINDSLHYTDGNNNIYFTIEDFYKTGPDYVTGFSMEDIDCLYNGYYSSDLIENNYQLYENFSNDYTGEIFEVNITKNDSFRFYRFKKLILPLEPLDIRFHEDTIINEEKYMNVYHVSKTSMTETEKISWIIKAEGKGIIQFHDDELDKTWTLVSKP